VTVSIDWLVVGGPVDPWRALGLVPDVAADGSARLALFGTGVLMTGEGDPGPRGIVVSGLDAGGDLADLDGVGVTVADPAPPLFAVHPLGARSIDHVVIVTDDLLRTCGAIADGLGAPLKRVREAGDLRQGFHRIGGLVVEVVERRGLDQGPASLWGLALVVDDLDEAFARLGRDVLSEPREAVQAGRSIATVTDAAGVGVALALMSPDPR